MPLTPPHVAGELPAAGLRGLRRAVERDARLLWRALRRTLRRWPLAVLLAAALVNLGLGLAYTEPLLLTTRIAADVVYANFGFLLGAALLCASASLGAGRSAAGLAARAGALVAIAWTMLVLAAALAALVQTWRGDALVDIVALCLGIFPGLGLHFAHLIALAVFMQALRSGWAGAGATAGAYALALLPAHFGIDHPLLRFGAPLVPWSDMAGFGPFLPGWIAATIVWTALAVLLLVAAHLVARRRPTRRIAEVAWTAAVFAVVAAGWLLATDKEIPAAAPPAPPTSPGARYARLALEMEIYPHQRRLAVDGLAVLAHVGDEPLPALSLALPAGLVLDDVEVTGERLPSAPRIQRFRLNRPLEPGERLRLAFTGRLLEPPVPRLATPPRLLANGANVRLADVIPTIGSGPSQALLQLRVGTSLEQMVVAPGELAGSWKEEGRSYYEYQTAQPVSLALGVYSGRYVRHDDPEAGIVAYLHPRHAAAGSAWSNSARGTSPEPASPPRTIVEVPDFTRTFAAPRLAALPRPTVHPLTSASIAPISELAWTQPPDRAH